MSNLTNKLKKGTKVKITTKGQYNGQTGFVRYIGPIEEKIAEGDYIGLQLEKPVGKNNGTHNGKQYFKTKPNYGIFLKPTSLALMDGTPVVPPISTKAPATTKAPTTSNKLSKDLEELQKVEENKVQENIQKSQSVPVKTEKAQKQQKSQIIQKVQNIEKLEVSQSELKIENDELKKKIKSLDEQIRTLKMQNQKIKYTAKQKDEGKENQLKQQIQFYKGQKQTLQKEKADLKKKIVQLNAQLEEYAQNMGMVDTLTIKIQNLQSKNQKLKQELQATKGELKNFKMVGESSGQSQAQLNQNLKILNETVTLLESDLSQMAQRTIQLEQELKKKDAALGETKKLQRKLKQKQEQLQQMSSQLQLMSDTANFVQKLTMNMLKKDEQLKQATQKLTQYLSKYQTLQNQLAINKQFSDQLNQQLFHQQQLMDRYSKQIQQKNKHITQLNRQIQKYKKKIFEITQTNQSISMSISQISQDKQEIIMKPIFGDQYQNKYYNALKVNNQIRKSQLRYLIQFSQIRNQVGVYILNLNQALPQSFTSKLYPEVISILANLKTANDKLYYIFSTVCDLFKTKPDIYSKQNQQLAQWLIILLKTVITLYGCLHKIQFTFTTSENQQQISQILDHRILKDQIRRVNNFALEILQRFVDDNVSASVDLEPFVALVDSFDEINVALKKNFSTQYDTKMRLCSDAMETVTNILEVIMKYKHTNQLGQNAEVDNSLQLFVRTVMTYLKQCCMNPYIRLKSQMKPYLEGLNLISNILGDINVQGNYHELNSLYSETQNIKMLRQTILTTQYHANALQNDLKDIVYTSQVSKIQTQLPGKFWQQRIKLIKEQLLKVKQVSDQKVELQQSLLQAKKKILLLQRQLKDKQTTKQLYEKRIGQLQLKVQQVSTIQNQNKRQAQKLKSYEDANKSIGEQIINLTRKLKLSQQQNKKIKQKFDTLQTQTMMRNKKQRNPTTMTSQDVANLTIFKNAIKQSNQLRNLDIKKKMMALKQSPIYLLKQTKTKQEQPTNLTSTRSKVFDQISKFTINDPFVSKKNKNQANLDSILLEIDKLKINKLDNVKNQVKQFKIGVLTLASLEAGFGKIYDGGSSIVVN